MTLSVPLSVRLVTAKTDRHVELELQDLSFRSVIPGGFASARMSLNRPLRIQPDEIVYYGRVVVYDKRTGETVWEGRLEDPGRGVGTSGEIWELAALGSSVHVHDQKFPYVMVHTDVGDWRKAEYSSDDMRSGSVEVVDFGGIGIRCAIPASVEVPTNARAAALYNGILEAGQELALISYRWDTGLTSSNYAERCTTEDGTIVREDDADTAGGAASTRVVGTNWTIGQASPRLAMQWDGPTLTNNDQDRHWAFFADVVLAAVRYAKTGTKISSGYTAANALVYADQVVADLLGRILNQYDGTNAVVDTNSFGFDQMAYHDGTTAAQVLDDLILFEPTFYWAAWENRTGNGYRFEWRAWPTTIGYEADVTDGYNSTGSGGGLYNEVKVRWEATNGLVYTNTSTSTVPELDDAGLTRSDIIDLGKELASSINATRIGEQWLEDHALPLNQGQLTIARPILDRDLGRMVMPWELRPGKLIRVRGINASSDALNATTRDGVAVFKVIAVDYNSQSASATLELDSQPLTMAHYMARLEGRPGIKTGRRTSRTV